MSDDPADGQPSQPPTLQPLTAAQASCPWCSAVLTDPSSERCPACGARLVGDHDASIPGVTTIDLAALRSTPAPPAPAPRRGFLRGLLDPTPRTDAADLGPASLDALAPPSREVLEEMRRLRAELAAAAAAEAAAEAGAGAPEAHEAHAQDDVAGLSATDPAEPA